jgi:hypothetical protein
MVSHVESNYNLAFLVWFGVRREEKKRYKKEKEREKKKEKRKNNNPSYKW